MDKDEAYLTRQNDGNGYYAEVWMLQKAVISFARDDNQAAPECLALAFILILLLSAE